MLAGEQEIVLMFNFVVCRTLNFEPESQKSKYSFQ